MSVDGFCVDAQCMNVFGHHVLQACIHHLVLSDACLSIETFRGDPDGKMTRSTSRGVTDMLVTVINDFKRVGFEGLQPLLDGLDAIDTHGSTLK